jgi:hypothetical protein
LPTVTTPKALFVRRIIHEIIGFMVKHISEIVHIVEVTEITEITRGRPRRRVAK